MIKRLLLVLLSIFFVISLIGCQTENEASDNKKIVIGSKPHTEQYILGEMLAILIEENSDIQVEKKLGIAGGTVNLHPAILEGEIDMYPEYTGTAWLTVLKKDPIKDPEKLYEETKKAYSEQFNVEWADIYGFNNSFALAVKESKAQELGLKKYSDLVKVSNQFVFGSNFQFYEREDGFNGLVDIYGFNFKDTKEIEIALKYQAIDSGQVDVINAFTTDGGLLEYNLKVLEDDKNFFISYHAATIVRKETLDKYPELAEILDSLSNKISDEEMMEMNYQVDKNKKDPAEVAREFLRKEGLI